MMKRLFLAMALFLMFPAVSYAKDANLTVVDFNGELIDQDAAPVSGVIPLEFRVYTDSKSKKAIATETMFVSVVDGMYSVTLGENSTIKSNQDKLYVAVYLDGKELTRQEVRTQKQIVASNPKVVTTETAGAERGDSFRLECPAGYVATGIEGNMKGGIQGIRVICSQVR